MTRAIRSRTCRPAPSRSASMTYRRCGASGVLLPAVGALANLTFSSDELAAIDRVLAA